MAGEPGTPDDNDRGIERLIFFTDAVVAIAITLLILPLVDIVPEYANVKGHTLEGFINANLSQLFAFVLSFVIIARLWLSNHHLLVNTARVTPALMWIDIAWVFTIVVLPLPTEITAVFKSSELSVTIYIGCSLSSVLLLTVLALYLYRHPWLEREHTRISAMQLWGIASSAGGFVLALVVELIFPRLTYYPLLLIMLSTPAGYFVKPRIARRDAARETATKAVSSPAAAPSSSSPSQQ